MSPRPRPFARTMLAGQSDERLVELLREGHEQAFDEIVRRYRGPLVAFATAIVGHDRAEDAVQAGLEKAHRALLADRRAITLRPWLFTIVRNGSLNLIRSEPAAGPLDPSLACPAPDADPVLLAERNEEMERVVTAICALPSAQREALVRRELEGVGHGEIAARLDTTATAVRGLIFRARTQLRNAVGALVPLPVLRATLAPAPAAGAAGGGASAALAGVAGVKGGIAVAAAVLALGAGIALEKRHGGDGGGDLAVASAAERSHAEGRGGAGRGMPGPASIESGGRPARRTDGTGPRGGDRVAADPGSAAAGPGERPASSGGGSGSPGSTPAPGDGPSGGGGPSGGPEVEAPEPPESDDDPGPGSDDTGDEVEVEDPPEPVEAPDPDERDPGDDDGESGD